MSSLRSAGGRRRFQRGIWSRSLDERCSCLSLASFLRVSLVACRLMRAAFLFEIVRTFVRVVRKIHSARYRFTRASVYVVVFAEKFGVARDARCRNACVRAVRVPCRACVRARACSVPCLAVPCRAATCYAMPCSSVSCRECYAPVLCMCLMHAAGTFACAVRVWPCRACVRARACSVPCRAVPCRAALCRAMPCSSV